MVKKLFIQTIHKYFEELKKWWKMEECCYKIPYYKEVEKAIIYALGKRQSLVSLEFFEDWKKGKTLLPISILDKACEINRKDPFVPIRYQFTWFCLNGKKHY